MYYVMEIEQRIFNRLGTTTKYLNLEILNFNYWCNVIVYQMCITTSLKNAHMKPVSELLRLEDTETIFSNTLT